MIAEFGAFALILALAFAIAQLALSAVGRARRSTVLAAAGEGAALASFIGVALAFACLVYAFVTSDFSVANVAHWASMTSLASPRLAATAAAVKSTPATLAASTMACP